MNLPAGWTPLRGCAGHTAGSRHQALTHHIRGRPIYRSKELSKHNNDLLLCQHPQCPLIRTLSGSITIIKSHVWDFRSLLFSLNSDHAFQNFCCRHLISALGQRSSIRHPFFPFLSPVHSELSLGLGTTIGSPPHKQERKFTLNATFHFFLCSTLNVHLINDNI